MAVTPIAYQIAGKGVLCSQFCLTPPLARLINDALEGVLAGETAPLGDVHPWTVDLHTGDAPLRCGNCRRVLVEPPPPDPGDQT